MTMSDNMMNQIRNDVPKHQEYVKYMMKMEKTNPRKFKLVKKTSIEVFEKIASYLDSDFERESVLFYIFSTKYAIDEHQREICLLMNQCL